MDPARQCGTKPALATFEDGARVFYVFDREDENFGFAFNIDAPQNSEWGYAPVHPDQRKTA